MSILAAKISAAVLIFFISLAAGALTNKINPLTWRFHFAETLASGIFLGAAIFHMLPDAEQGFRMNPTLSSYPWANLTCAFSLLMLLAMEQLLAKKSHNNTPTSYMPITILSLHSLLEGTALGINVNTGEALMIFIAIIAHKGLDSFALCTHMQASKLTKKHFSILLLIFSMMTPLGIIIASSLTLLLHSYTEQLFQPIFNALGAGAFFYLASTHRINDYIHGNHELHSMHYLLAISMGLAAMAILAIWI